MPYRKLSRMMQLARRAVQAAVLGIFLLLVLLPPVLVESGIDAGMFVRLSPLAAIQTIAAGAPATQVLALHWPAAVLIAATILLGRFFCGWVCPLGTAIDLTDRLLRPIRNRRENLPGGADGRRLKYYLLAAVAVMAMLGVGIVGWIDPLTMITRVSATVVQPSAAWLSDSIFSSAHERLPAVREPVDALRSGIDRAVPTGGPHAYYGAVFIAVLFLGVPALGALRARCWCRGVCPLGALLAAISQWSLLKRRVSPACTRCGACKAACKMEAVGDDYRATLGGECVLCQACSAACEAGAVAFSGPAAKLPEKNVDLTRRGLIVSGLAAVAAVPLLKMSPGRNAGSAEGGQVPVIRPPGALPEDEFLDRCTRCGECLRVCKTNGLQPAALQAGLEGLWTPHLVPRIGHCVRDCTLCGQACPSGAIESLRLEQKHAVVIGKAAIDHSRCIPWLGWATSDRGDCNCAVCEEVCPLPTKAIRFTVERPERPGGPAEIRRPYVVDQYCTGCGFCEKVCPVPGDAAIRIYPARGMAATDEPAGEAAASIAALLPAKAAGFTRAEAPARYVGSRLVELVDGEAPKYLARGFVQVAAARYAGGDGEKVRVEIWEFAGAARAAEVYQLDAVGLQPLANLGDQAGIAANMIWGRKGKYYFRTGSSRVDAGKVTALVREIVAGIP